MIFKSLFPLTNNSMIDIKKVVKFMVRGFVIVPDIP